MKTRASAAKVLYQVVDKGQSLTTALPTAQQLLPAKDRALLQEICYGVLRWLPRLEFISRQLMSKPLIGKQRPVHFLILVGLYQLKFMRIPAHAAVAETVNAIKVLKSPKLSGLVNAVLRNYQRQQDDLETLADGNDTCKFGHPGWLIKRIKAAYPKQWQDVLMANNERPPMWIRVNQQHHNQADYQALLAADEIVAEIVESADSALRLAKPTDVYKLAGFAEGHSSVQDGAAQFAAQFLDAQPGELILDACAAPGGKTAHILERQPALKHLVAVDFDATRLSRVQENLTRMQLDAELIHGDASKPEDWWQGDKFDRILLDAPCSATGVIRRHPDIKWLRRDSDIAPLVQLQAEILDAMWLQLKPGGTLLYATCSILPAENSEQISSFVARTPDAVLVPLNADSNDQAFSWQILPNTQGMDGFFYAKLQKKA
ncbi:16S rRNA (cytosine(967)-C(5))-methyltransferase RsmB [Moritella sp.]|uniref:16S rRNA (cytosine(967)-C(5))-methyltransferase RsmB n=1 Tax=Moritella sp. TaxID=78556 RepID=UPI001D87B145|nr:16S rRNA (cytosine(967)-C(5))-methyltransferase RsmB [Moritella sp.]MCJ8351650.1 16S rRNA (cytosine(967)-C(5))-methyltransferase RsmB [Moritella sp.]NQZ41698.1 16S rRNA (cytosine(967)-C(5))-methyltransferase RsmB [Moritella sp.]